MWRPAIVLRTSARGTVPPDGYAPAQALGLLAFLIAATIAMELTRLPLIVLVDPVRHSFGIGDVEVSLLLGVLSSVPFVGMSLVGGFLSDRLSRKWLLGLAITTWTVGAIVCAMAPGFAAFAVGRVLIGIGAGMKLPIAMTWINDAFPPARRARAIGAFFVVLGTGPSLAVILAGAAYGWARTGGVAAAVALPGGGEPWRATIALLAVPSIAALLAIPLLRDTRAHETADEAVTTHDRPRARDGRLALLVAGAALMALVDAGNLAWVSTIFIRDYGFDAARAGAIFGVATLIAGLAGPMIGGALGDALFRRRGQGGRLLLAAGAALAIVPLLASYLLHVPSLLIGALTLSGICTVMALSLSYVMVQAVLPPRGRGLGTGVVSAATTLVGSAGPTLVAVVAERFGAAAGASPGGLTIAVVIVAGGAALAAAVLFFVCALVSAPRDAQPVASAV